MKIAIVSQPIDIVLPPFQNSVGACSYGMACALAKQHEVVVYVIKSSNNEPGEVQEKGVTFRFLERARTDDLLTKLRTRVSRVLPLGPASTSRLFFPQYGSEVARALGRENFDVIHIQHSSQYAPVIRKFSPKAKIVVHLHAEWFSQSNPRKLLARVAPVDLLTGVSDYVVGRVRELLPSLQKPSATHYNGFDPGEFSRDKDYHSLSQRTERRIMFAGGISPHKGIHVLMEAFSLVAAECPDVRLVLSGPTGTYPWQETFDRRDVNLLAELTPYYLSNLSWARKLAGSAKTTVPNYQAQLKAMVPAHLRNRVEFLGMIPRSKLIDAYYESDVFVFPSLFAEGFGLPPVEAMASGTPVVGTKSGAIVETVLDGVTGLLVERNDSRALAGALLQLLNSAPLRERMGRAGRERALEHFTWDAVTATMSANYERLSSGRSLVDPV
jgi:glycosyltransferase involved in cell wall biosynthesis